MKLTRRSLLAAGVAMPFISRTAFSQSNTITIGALTPQTGAGGSYGPSMLRTIRAVVEEVNGAGGVLGRKVELISENDETNPEAGVRAARKLIDVNKVSAILGTWASSVTTAVAPLCWENKVMLFTVSGADSITQLPHQGFIIRTQPNSRLQSTRIGQFLLKQGAKRTFVMSAQTPFAVSGFNVVNEVMTNAKTEVLGHIVYDPAKATFRSELDQILKTKPDTIFFNSYTPDLTTLLRELYRLGFEGRKHTMAYAANAKLLESLPAEVTQGLTSMAPSPDVDSPVYKKVIGILGTNDPDPYSCQTYDHITMALLAIAKAGEASGPAIHGNVRKISQGGGTKVASALEGLKLLSQKTDVNFDGASGPCDFNDVGDIIDCRFRFEMADAGKYKLLEIS
jgi:branched-chain amino acid transport system substrate-binding protein